MLPTTGKDLPYEAGVRESDEAAGYDGHTRPLLQDDEYTTVSSPERDYVVAEVAGRGKARSPSSASSSTKVARASTSGSGNGVEFTADLEAHPVNSPLTARVAATPLLSSEGSRGSPSKDRLLSKEEWQVFPDDMFAVPATQCTKAELVARTPWKQFFTHPVARGLLVAAFCYVSGTFVYTVP
jgi:hypothetical protein